MPFFSVHHLFFSIILLWPVFIKYPQWMYPLTKSHHMYFMSLFLFVFFRQIIIRLPIKRYLHRSFSTHSILIQQNQIVKLKFLNFFWNFPAQAKRLMAPWHWIAWRWWYGFRFMKKAHPDGVLYTSPNAAVLVVFFIQNRDQPPCFTSAVFRNNEMP